MKTQNEIINKVYQIFQNNGLFGGLKKIINYASKRIFKNKNKNSVLKDVLFIDGCGKQLPHPSRYRITHQREQLESYNISTNEIFYLDITTEQIAYYRVFIFFRCPFTNEIGEFIKKAKKINKTIIFDIDDLVIDTKYTNTINYLDTMEPNMRMQYDTGVNDMQHLLVQCNGAITTTKALEKELTNYVSNVFINRNVASQKMLELSHSACLLKKQNNLIKIGYFSGSITHNEDFELIIKPLCLLLDKYQKIELHVAGELDIPLELDRYSNRIKIHPFINWTKLPHLLSEMDINLAPLKSSIFNEAKSENKWIEAALVKVVTIASNVGAFSEMILDGDNGVLCNDNEWYEKLEYLIEHSEYRELIAENAYQYCSKRCSTIYNAKPLSQYVLRMMSTNYVFILPSLQISGGVMVALKHASVLQKHGNDVTLMTLDKNDKWYKYEETCFPVSQYREDVFCGVIDYGIATMWTTVKVLEKNENIKHKIYLVQNYETDFYENGNPLKILANKSYTPKSNIDFLTVSKWCQEWLKEKYEQNAVYIPNGIESKYFIPQIRTLQDKIKILIEGDCTVYYKNVDEAFEITNCLNHDLYEIWYMSYNGQPKKHYKIDKFLYKIPYQEVGEIYNKCDILLKTSLLESFSYPPLEMMATGGYVVAILNDGNKEYLRDGYNCIIYPQGNIKRGVSAIEKIIYNQEVRERLYNGGIETVKSRDWMALEEMILKGYLKENQLNQGIELLAH